jgi:hypothetical protein
MLQAFQQLIDPFVGSYVHGADGRKPPIATLGIEKHKEFITGKRRFVACFVG